MINRENGKPWAEHSWEELREILVARIEHRPIFKDKRGDITRWPSSAQCFEVLAEIERRGQTVRSGYGSSRVPVAYGYSRGGDSMSMQQQQQTQQTRLAWGSKSPLTLDAMVPDERTASDLVSRFTTDQAVKEVSFRREADGTPHIRISLQPGAVQQFQDRIQQLTDAIQRSYQSAGYGQS